MIGVLCFVLKPSSVWPHAKVLFSTAELLETLQHGPGLALLLWLLHLSRRWAECSFLHVWSDATMHVVVLAFGLLHYIGANASLLLAAEGACADTMQHGTVTSDLMYVAGFLLVVLGQGGQHWAHRQLAALRRPPPPQHTHKHTPARSVGKYHLPSGGMFALSSSPHYTCEVCIYAGLALLCGGSAPMLLLLAWSATNLALSAVATQAWYKAKFDETPSAWAIFPGIL